MKKTFCYCDRCHKEVSERDLDTIFIPYDLKPYGLVKSEMELCRNCQMKWSEFGKQFLKERE